MFKERKFIIQIYISCYCFSENSNLSPALECPEITFISGTARGIMQSHITKKFEGTFRWGNSSVSLCINPNSWDDYQPSDTDIPFWCWDMFHDDDKWQSLSLYRLFTQGLFWNREQDFEKVKKSEELLIVVWCANHAIQKRVHTGEI